MRERMIEPQIDSFAEVLDGVVEIFIGTQGVAEIKVGHAACRPESQGSPIMTDLLAWILQGVSKGQMKPEILRVIHQRGTK